ncbi:MAG: hypothetical protein ACK5RG_00250 [Cyclobacteriaceae bacterium]|jgi:hypothetical protein|nr:hypothetical protein [Flammeovirgaceae bacterium]
MEISINKTFIFTLLAGSTLILSCGRTATSSEKTNFTHADSLTETFLTFQDTLLHSWNRLAKEEHEKLDALEKALHGLIRLSAAEPTQITSLHNRLDQLKQIHITQKTLSNPYVVEEYDFASTSLISEVLSLMETNPTIISDQDLVDLIDAIKLTDQQIGEYRISYDSIATAFNSFIEKNRPFLKDADHNNLEKRPIFNVAAK